MTHRRVKHAALPVHPRPSGRIIRPLIRRAVHASGFLDENDVQVVREFLERIPFFHQFDFCTRVLQAGKFSIRHAQFCFLLLCRMSNKFAAEHFRVIVRLRTVIFVARQMLLRFSVLARVRVKCVRRRMHADESFSIFHRVEQSRLARRSHRRKSIGADDQRTVERVKAERVELRDIFRRKQTAVLREREFNPIFRAETGKNFFGETQFGSISLDDGMFIAGRF